MSLREWSRSEPPVLVEEPRRRVGVPGTLRTAGLAGHLDAGGSQVRGFVSPRTRAEHYFRKFDGYGLSLSVLPLLTEWGIARVLIAETDTGTVYEYLLRDFERHGSVYDNEGDRQLVLSTEYAMAEHPDHADRVLA